MKRVLLLGLAAFAALEGCAMFTAWKSIPPPGGCDECHTVAISSNWQVAYKPATVADERGRQAFQTPEYNMPVLGKQESPLETKKVQELQCFECHKSPTPAHRERKGRFHH
ncbi:cytochrome C [Pelotalea chapellei]|uniref:Cytochrome C n=1 Tax=Pelotalea chapellei TaxID=44671 RepID=A0ABS5U527_9BACT|nr:cytochrome C [Pelotalea chapellei]MBT1070750.1 cytochrome C [Pelotalea chapellei]